MFKEHQKGLGTTCVGWARAEAFTEKVRTELGLEVGAKMRTRWRWWLRHNTGWGRRYGYCGAMTSIPFLELKCHCRTRRQKWRRDTFQSSPGGRFQQQTGKWNRAIQCICRSSNKQDRNIEKDSGASKEPDGYRQHRGPTVSNALLPEWCLQKETLSESGWASPWRACAWATGEIEKSLEQPGAAWVIFWPQCWSCGDKARWVRHAERDTSGSTTPFSDTQL